MALAFADRRHELIGGGDERIAKTSNSIRRGIKIIGKNIRGKKCGEQQRCVLEVKVPIHAIMMS